MCGVRLGTKKFCNLAPPGGAEFYEAVLGRKVRLVIWGPASRGEPKEKKKRKTRERQKRRTAVGEPVDSCHNSPRQPSPKECIQHRKVSTATDSRSADKFYFIFYPTHPLHYLFLSAYRIVTPQQGRPKGKNIRGTEVEGRGQLRNDSCQLPRRRGRADVSDPVVRHPPERGTNPLPRTKDPTARMDLPGA